jgi:hypothetical protein
MLKEGLYGLPETVDDLARKHWRHARDSRLLKFSTYTVLQRQREWLDSEFDSR